VEEKINNDMDLFCDSTRPEPSDCLNAVLLDCCTPQVCTIARLYVNFADAETTAHTRMHIAVWGPSEYMSTFKVKDTRIDATRLSNHKPVVACSPPPLTQPEGLDELLRRAAFLR
jgi:hypothetical protein